MMDPVQPDALLALLLTTPGFDEDSVPAWLLAECKLSLESAGYMDGDEVDREQAVGELVRTRHEPVVNVEVATRKVLPNAETKGSFHTTYELS